MKDNSSKWLVETGWLEDHLNAPDLVIVDASYAVPTDFDSPYEHYLQQHIPGALFFDIDEIADTSNPLPHMLPPPEKFAARMRKMGIGDGKRVVAYDSSGIVSAARAWWMFRVMGHDDVAVLNGGLPKWKAENRPLESTLPVPRSERHFTARMRAELVRDLNDMKNLVAYGGAQIVDARSADRFAGTAPEPRQVARMGHIPGSFNLPFVHLFEPDGTMKSPEGIREAFAAARVDLNQPIVTTCGSGVTACILSLGLAICGYEHAAVYDGSWTEWSQAEEAPVETGPAARTSA